MREESKSVAHATDVDDAVSTLAANAPDEAGTPGESSSFPIVGVGASAGGLEAFTHFLRALPADTGMAFVLVQHLAPSHESALAEILSRATSMPVAEVADEPEIEPNRVYVIPPDRNMTIVSGRLRLFKREARGKHHPIDQFFSSLAQSQRHMAIGVVLSGTATDGTLGLEEIKAEGGITFAQDDTAQHGGMPQSAVASGCVDFVLPPESIAAEIERIATHPYVAQPHGTRGDGLDASNGKQALSPILHLLRGATDVDFTQYKVNTLSRRIRRRMVLLKKQELEEYAQHLRDNPAEVQALYQDILINVTSFFRDPAMFEVLKGKVIPALFKDRSRHEPFRAWVLGCSTGEEAYSLAMLLTEAMDSGNGHAPPQLFATDLNASGVEKARAGVYPPERLQDVSRERLRRFFVERNGGFQVAKPIRDMCVFSRHNAMTDPPFSRMDLVSCRNVLIYLEPSLQQRIIPILHYALKPAGFLVLGASETVGPFRDLFGVEDAKHKIFGKKPGSGRLPLFPATHAQPSVPLNPLQKAQRTREPGIAARVAAAFGGGDVEKEADRLLLSFAPPAVLVDGNFDILQYRGNTEPYLVAPQGKATHALLKMAREGLLVPLRGLLTNAKKDNARVRQEGVRIRRGDGYEQVNLEVAPVKGRTEEGCFLILFEDVATLGVPRKKPARRPKAKAGALPQEFPEANTVRLEHELASTREYLQALIEQHDSANEELQSANEEAQSANEELQSINEELETSKEEIQSSNEELTTLNEELHNRNVETGQLNSDLTNLITSVQVAIVIVGRDLRIRRFSPKAEQILNIIPTDVGRPITDIRMNAVLPELEALLVEAIDTVSPREREVQGKGARWYSLRIRPYMTLENKIDGAVLMLVDVDTLRHARDYAESVVATVRDPLLILDPELRVRTANGSFYESFRVAREETEGRLIYELGNGQWNIPELRRLLEELLPSVSNLDDYIVEHDFEGIGRKVMRLTAKKLSIPGEERESILLAIEDTTEAHGFQADLRHSEQRYRRLFEAAKDGVLILNPQSRKIIDANPFMTELLGYARDEFLGKELFEIGLLKDEEASRAAFRELKEKGVLRYEDLPLESKNGGRREVEMVSNRYEENGTSVIQCNIRDISERKAAEAALRASEVRLATESDALSRLNELSSDLWRMQSLRDGLNEMLGATIELLGADLGNIQLLNVERGVLLIAAQRGFRQDFLEFFREVSAEDDSACARALRSGERIVIEDIEADAQYAPLRPIARAAGYRAVQSTPLVGRDGTPLGMLSAHFGAVHHPSEQELRRLDLYVRQAADFIERCRAEDTLRESEERFRSLVMASTAVFWTTDAEGAFATPQPSWEAYTGQAREKYQGWGWANALHPDDRSHVEGLWRRALESRSQYESQGRVRHGPSQAYRHFEARAVPVLSEDGSVREWIGTCADVHDRRMAEILVESQRKALQLLAEGAVLDDVLGFLIGVTEHNSPDGMIAAITTLNAAGTHFERGIGASLPDAYNAAVEGVAVDSPIGLCANAVRRREAVAVQDFSENPEWQPFGRFVAPYGLRSGWSTPIVSSSGQVLGTYANYYRHVGDPTPQNRELVEMVVRTAAIAIERRRAEEALTDSENRHRSLFESAPMAVFACDKSATIYQYNARAVELWGREPICGVEQHCGSTKLWLPDGTMLPHAQSPIVEVLRTGVPASNVEVSIERPDGSRLPVLVNFAALKNARGEVTGAITSFIDITGRKQLEEELANRNEALTEADREKNNFLAVLSHELRSPLSAIRGWVQMLQRPDVSAENMSQGLAVIDRQSRAQAELIADLMDVHRMVSGKVRLDTSEIDLAVVISSAIEAALPSAAEKEIRINREIEPGSTLILGDVNRLQQVFFNLLSNAIKFTPPKGEILVDLRRAGSRAEVKVSDTGEGIAPEAVRHLFEKFRQADPSTSRGHGGLGLGLAIVKQLVELHGGGIRGQSPGRGKGATFTITLPLRSAEDALRPRALSKANGDGAPVSLGGALVLIVDDEVDAREPLRNVLEEAGAEVVAVGSADEAMVALRQQRPDVLVSDIGMPGRDGYDLVRSIRTLPQASGGRIPAIALTAYASSEERDRALRAGFDMHLAKPVESAELIGAIATFVARNSRGGGGREESAES